jgi:hypothetical protein
MCGSARREMSLKYKGIVVTRGFARRSSATGLLMLAVSGMAAPLVSVERVPGGGIQPQIVVDRKGTAHLLYFAGDPKAGNLFYTRRENGAWTQSLRVNQSDGSAIAVGTIRGGQLAIGANGRVHVAWNGAKALTNSPHKGVPMFYTRLSDEGYSKDKSRPHPNPLPQGEGTAGDRPVRVPEAKGFRDSNLIAFEAERDVMRFTGDLDGGGSVAVDAAGNVYVVWHGHAPEAKAGEVGRAVFVAKSTDDGVTFAREVAVNPEPTGTCGCCGLKAFADARGALYVLYRGATEMVNRDEILMVSTDGEKEFRSVYSDPWKVGTCPMSSAAMVQSGEGVVTAWETAGQVHLGIVKDGKLSRVTPPGGSSKRKHPAVTSNQRGEILLVWTEGTGWERGGALAWQVFDETGKPLGESGRRDGVPVWSFGGAYAAADGGFVVVY